MTAPVHLHPLGHDFLHIALTRRCCSNAGFLFLGTLLRLSALSARAQPGGDSPQCDTAAGSGEASRVVPGVGRMDGIILDSAPAPITPDIAARWAAVESGHHLLRYNMRLRPHSPGAWRPRPSPRRWPPDREGGTAVSSLCVNGFKAPFEPAALQCPGVLSTKSGHNPDVYTTAHLRRGFKAAVLSQPALGMHDRHPGLVHGWTAISLITTQTRPA